jgi:hypothetical protein
MAFTVMPLGSSPTSGPDWWCHSTPWPQQPAAQEDMLDFAVDFITYRRKKKYRNTGFQQKNISHWLVLSLKPGIFPIVYSRIKGLGSLWFGSRMFISQKF